MKPLETKLNNYNEDLELEKCFICGKEHTKEHYIEKGLYQGKYTYDEPFPDYYICYCNSCNKKYQALKQKARDTNYKFEKQLLSKIRKAIKKECKTLSITISHSVWDVSIKPLDKDKPYRSFNFEELKTLVKFKIFDSTEHKTNLATIKDMYYFYLTRTDLIEPEVVTQKPKTEVKKMQTPPKTNGLTLKILENGELASFIPKKVWYAMFKQKIIVKKNGNWIVDLTKKDQIQIPIEIVETKGFKQKKSLSLTTTTTKTMTKKKKNNDLETFKNCFLQAIQFANTETKYFKDHIEEKLPFSVIGDSTDTMASLQGKPTGLKNIQGAMFGDCGFASVQFFNLNSFFGRMIKKWIKTDSNPPFSFSKGNSRYGHHIYPNIQELGITQIMQLKTKAYSCFVGKLNHLLKENGFEEQNLYIYQRID